MPGIERSVVFGLVTLVAIGLTDFVRKIAVSAGAPPASYLFVESLVLAVVILGLSLVAEDGINVTAPAMWLALASGLLVAVAIGSLLYGLRLGEASIVAPLGRLGLLVTAVLAIVFLRESLTATKLLGIVCAVLAVILLSRS